MQIALANTARLNRFSGIILDAAISVHKEMGPGLLETVYQNCLVKELRNREILVSVSVPVTALLQGRAVE